MQCKKCSKEIMDESIFCNYCGTKQVREKPKERKKPNGHGGIVKLSGRRRKPWAIRKSFIDEDGKQKFRYINFFERRSDAVKSLALEQVQPTSEKAGITFKELFEEWKLTKAYTTISKDTQYCYTGAYKHFFPLHKKKFTEIRTAAFQQCIDEAVKKVKDKETKKESTQPLSHSAKRHMKVLAGLLYKYAMENDICNKNYAQFIRMDRVEKTEHKIFSDLEIEKLFKSDGVPGVDIILILIYSGLRINELLNLTKTSIDIDKGIITGGLKTDSGKNRTVPVHPKIAKYVHKYYDAADTYLFMRDERHRLTDTFFRSNLYRPALEALEIEFKPVHSTRHTFATMLTKNGADTKAIEELMGHSDYAFTADTYTVVDVEFLETAINKI